jgi:hypothetical protein
MELLDLQNFIKKNSKINELKIHYTDDGDIYEYKINIEGIDYIVKIIDDGDILKFEYNGKILDNDIDIQLELFELFNYKNIEYIDCFILKKRNINNFEILDMYDDNYDNIEKKYICNRSIMKNEELKKIKIVIYDETEYIMYYDMEEINGFDEILKKIDLIL